MPDPMAMSAAATWVAAALTVAILIGYEIWLAVGQRLDPQRVARSAHAGLRAQWFDALSRHKGTEILAVQTLRNSLMAATMTASTAVLGLMGTVTLAAPTLNLGLADSARRPQLTAHLWLELVLLTLLFASLVSSAMAIRYYNLAGFVAAMPVESEARQRWMAAGTAYLRRAGRLYNWGLRHLILIAPIVASIMHPVAGPPAGVLIVLVLLRFDHAHRGPKDEPTVIV